MGGLGNQLFQLNFANYLHRHFPNIKISLNTSFFNNDSRHGGYLLEKHPFKIDNHKHRGFIEITDETYSECLDFSKDIIFNGYWQNIKFFDNQSYNFEDFFKFNINKCNKTTAKQISETKNSVSIHVRCGDYNNHFLLGNVATKAYFNNAITKIYDDIENPVFFVFSDDITWTKDNLIFKPESKIIYVDNRNSLRLSKWDIYLMSLCDYHINSNSSFSWWAQCFDNKQNKKVYLPEYWINEVCPGFTESKSSIQNIKEAVFIPNFPLTETKNDTPKYTIAISCYNQPMQIRRAISSVLNQTLTDFECLVIDDASTDDSVKVVSEYCTRTSKIRLIKHEKNSSLLSVRLTGAKEAKGRFLLYLDGDDYLMTDALKKIDMELDLHPELDILEFSYIMRPTNEIFNPPAYDKNKTRFENYLNNKPIVPTIWNKVYRTEFLKDVFTNIQPIYLNMAEDVYLSTCIAYKTKKYASTQIIAINYMVGNGISTKLASLNDNKFFLESVSIILEQLSIFFKIHNANENKAVEIIFSRLLENYISQINNRTIESDKILSLILLGKYFEIKKIAPFVTGFSQNSELGIKALTKLLIKKVIRKVLKK